MRELFCVIFFLASFTCANASFGRNEDSLKVYFIGHSNGERFLVKNGGEMIMKFRSKGAFKKTFYISMPASKKYGAAMNIYVLRKGRFSFFYRDVTLNSYFEPGYLYLVLIRDTTLKNRFAVRYEWSNREPYVHHLKLE